MEFNLNDIYDVNEETIQAMEIEVEDLRKKAIQFDAKWRLYERIGNTLSDSILMEKLTGEVDYDVDVLTRDHIENMEKIAEKAGLYQAKYQIAVKFLKELRNKKPYRI